MAVSYHQVAVTRARELWMRIVLAVVIAAGGWAVTHSLWAVVYLAAVIAVQLADLWVTAGLRRDPDFVASTLQEAHYLGWIAFNVAVFEALTPLCWLVGGPEGQIFGILVPVAGLLHISLQAESAPRLHWAGCVPHAA